MCHVTVCQLVRPCSCVVSMPRGRSTICHIWYCLIKCQLQFLLQSDVFCIIGTQTTQHIRIRWNIVLGNTIPVKCGTRKGGLSSALLFNIFYKDLVEEIESSQCGVTINDITYNIYCCADDILISSTTTSGLQSLIDKANVNLSSCGLNFNPQKSECIIVGGNPFTTSPKWHLNGEQLPVRDSIVYLGTVIGDRNGEKHTESRLRKATKSFYSLQGCGLNAHGVSPNTGLHIYNTAVRSTLTYGCSAVHISGKYLKKLDQLQGKIIKSILGIPYSSRTRNRDRFSPQSLLGFTQILSVK